MNLIVNVASTDRTNYILWRTFWKIDNINSKVDTCSFSTRKYGGKTWSPSVGDEIEVLDGADTIFAGVIIKVTERAEGSHLQRYDVQCKDWTHYLDRRLVTERYTDKTVAEIIADIITDYTSGFTVTEVSCDIPIDSISFNYVTVSQAIQMLAEQVNHSWYVDYSKDIHFFPKNNELSPFDLTDTNNKYVFKSLVVKDDLSQMRNRILVRGGDKQGSKRTKNFTGDEKKKTFPLGYRFAKKPIVLLAGSAIAVGTEFLDDEASYVCFWNYNEKYCRFTSTPHTGTAIAVTGTPYIPILVQVEDYESINTYGVYEFRKIDKSIKTTDEAKQYAVSQMDAYKSTIKEGRFQTYESGLRSGQVINVGSTIRSIDEDFLIQQVGLKMRGYNEGVYTVVLATLRTIGIIEFLQNLLLGETKKIVIGEDEVLEKYYVDHKDIQVTELIEVYTESEDHQSVAVTELIRKDPWTPIWVLSPYFPSSDADTKREGRLGISMFLY